MTSYVNESQIERVQWIEKEMDSMTFALLFNDVCKINYKTHTYLNTLFSEIFACSARDFDHHKSVANGLDSALDGHNPSSTLSRDIQVVRDCPGSYFQDIVRGRLVQEYATEGWDESPWRTPSN